MKKENYHAKLIIRGLPDMKSVTYRRLVDWLSDKVKELKNADSKDYSKIYTSKLIK